ncbi:MAG: DNA polymerase III, epsilon subunit [Parcubacteria bacterium 34_609]|jgi:DNA polymerase-3 subunit epsilon|nr:MAG: DNA polymerase III, epsilon subunit [Parcubacteria bacterium 34_609]KUK99448.1 MAG: DNA polymerase III, epsilon subunit [Parcubacteria bacterium 32_520]
MDFESLKKFNRETIEKMDPIGGLYFIFNDRQEIIFIGKSKNNKKELLKHLNNASNKSGCILKNNPTYFWTGFWLGSESLEDLIEIYNPICNK